MHCSNCLALLTVGDVSNLDESDVAPLEEHHFQGSTSPEFEFTISQTRLCLIFSKAMRKRVALRSTPTDRATATAEADAALATLITQLPEKLHNPKPDPDPWQAIFHLTYNNFLILLHRPSPSQDPECPSAAADTDLSICCDAATTICSIFESLRKRNLLNRLWIPSIHVLFTALVHVSDQMHSANPLIVAKSKRLYDSLILTLHALKGQWLYAQSLLALFEGKNATGSRRPQLPGATADSENGAGGGDVSRHSGDPSASRLQGHLGIGEGVLNGSATQLPAVRHPGHGQPASAHLGSTGLDPSDPRRPMSEEHGAMLGDVSQTNHIYGTNFVGDDMGMSGDAVNMDMLEVPSALELLLAGVGNDFGFHY